MANSWRRNQQIKIFTPKNLLLFFSTSLLLLIFLYLTSQTQPHNPKPIKSLKNPIFNLPIKPFDCYNSPQAYPVIASTVEGVKHPFLFSLSDFGNLPEKPHKNIQRVLKGKPFRKPDISGTVQELLEKMKGEEGNKGIFVDVGANVGMATFAAAVMGFKVMAFEPVFENLQRICEGVYFNRVGELVEAYEAAASDHNGNITFHKLLLLKVSFIRYWRASSDHFPCLERLFLAHCLNLDSIPQDFAAVTTLELIDINNCQQSVGTSAKQIQQDIQDNYGSFMEVHIRHAFFLCREDTDEMMIMMMMSLRMMVLVVTTTTSIGMYGIGLDSELD